ncbi:MAG: hypothetical protein ACR2QM_12545 [Longimicrobiales bacterium]
MSEHLPETPDTPAGIPPLPPDAENPAIIFAKKTYWWVLVFSAGFIGAVLLFIL